MKEKLRNIHMLVSSFYKMWQKTIYREICSRRIKPIDSIAFITYRCTSRCSTCNIWQKTIGSIKKFRDKELEPRQWIQILGKLHRAGVSTLEIFGGDALLRKDIVFPLVEKSKRLGIETFFPTNCNLLDQDTANKLVSSGLGTIYFSVDGTDDLQDDIRGVKGTYTRVVNAIWNVYHANQNKFGNTKMVILPTISNMNLEQVEDILNEFEKFPINSVYLRAMGEITSIDVENSIIDGIKATPFFISTSGKSHLLSDDQFLFLKLIIKKLRKNRNSKSFYLSLSYIESLLKITFTRGFFPQFPCHICTTLVTLTPSGEVVPCPFFTDFVIGNLEKEDSLSNIWGNERHRWFLRKQRNNEFDVCKKCSMRPFYPGIWETFRQVFYPYIFTPFK